MITHRPKSLDPRRINSEYHFIDVMIPDPSIPRGFRRSSTYGLYGWAMSALFLRHLGSAPQVPWPRDGRNPPLSSTAAWSGVNIVISRGLSSRPRRAGLDIIRLRDRHHPRPGRAAGCTINKRDAMLAFVAAPKPSSNKYNHPRAAGGRKSASSTVGKSYLDVRQAPRRARGSMKSGATISAFVLYKIACSPGPISQQGPSRHSPMALELINRDRGKSAR